MVCRWIDITYLNEDGTFRLTRGNKGVLHQPQSSHAYNQMPLTGHWPETLHLWEVCLVQALGRPQC